MKCLFCDYEMDDMIMGIPLCKYHKSKWFEEDREIDKKKVFKRIDF